jgi:hypothetical protein
MSDPFAILGTAGSVLTLVEFAWKLLADTRKIYKSASGENAGNAVLSTITEDVTRLGDTLALSSSYDDYLRALVEEAQSVARNLLEVLNKLKIHGTNTA